MILAKTPVRLPLAGGLSDLAGYAARFGGETISVTIDKHVYVTVKDDLEGTFDVRYRDTHEHTAEAGQLRHDLLREALRLRRLEGRPIDVDFRVDLAGESGLGTSGALTVSIVHALARLQGERPDPWTLLH